MKTQSAPDSPNRIQVLANGDIVDCASLPASARHSLYKTELCKHYRDTGHCRYGPKCQFAHGEDELRGVLRHPKYKTTKCKAFLTTGRCTYGSRCRFIHQDAAGNYFPSSGSESEDQEKNSWMFNPYSDYNDMDLSRPFSGLSLGNFTQQSSFGNDFPSLGSSFPKLDATDLESLTSTSSSSGGSSDAGLEPLSPRSDPDSLVSSKSSRLSVFQRICREDI